MYQIKDINEKLRTAESRQTGAEGSTAAKVAERSRAERILPKLLARGGVDNARQRFFGRIRVGTDTGVTSRALPG